MKPVAVRRLVIVTISAIIALVVIFRLSSNKSSDLQEVLKQSANIIPQDFINNNNARKQQEEFTQNLEKITENLLKKQEERLLKLEKERANLEKQLKELRRAPEGSSLREQLAFLFPYDQNRKFPAYIWQTWKYGLNDERFGDKFREGETQWAVKNPGFVHELFNDDTSSAIVHYLYKHIPEIVQAYEILPDVILKMDFFRYLILLAKGGVYSDVDTLPLQPVPNWIPENVSPSEIGMIIGISSDPDSADWRKHYARRLQFGNWCIQSKPGHPILREVVAKITELTLEKLKKNDLSLSTLTDTSVTTLKTKNLDIMQWTGLGVWTDVIFTYFNDYVQSGIYSKVTWKDFTKLDVPKLVSDVLILPITSFAPGLGKMGSQSEDHPLAFVKHYFENNWKN